MNNLIERYIDVAGTNTIMSPGDNAAHFAHARSVVLDEAVGDAVRKAHPPALTIQPQEMVPEFICFGRPDLANRTAESLLIAHDHDLHCPSFLQRWLLILCSFCC